MLEGDAPLAPAGTLRHAHGHPQHALHTHGTFAISNGRLDFGFVFFSFFLFLVGGVESSSSLLAVKSAVLTDDTDDTDDTSSSSLIALVALDMK